MQKKLYGWGDRVLQYEQRGAIKLRDLRCRVCLLLRRFLGQKQGPPILGG